MMTEFDSHFLRVHLARATVVTDHLHSSCCASADDHHPDGSR